MIPLDQLRRDLVQLADAVPPASGDARQAVRHRYRRRRLIHAASSAIVVAVVAATATLAVADQRRPQTVQVTSPGGEATATTSAPPTTTPTLPPGVLARSAILARYPPPQPGVSVSAKLVTLASLAQVDPELTQCEARGCPPGAYVWLVLEQGPPGSFPQSVPVGVTLAPGADAWTLFPVNATTGVARGDSEIGGDSGLANSAWARLSDLDG